MIDANFKKNKGKYIVQCLMATAVIAISLFMLDVVLDMAIVAALGSTSFIVFAMPHKQSASSRVVFWGNTFGILISINCYFLGEQFFNISYILFASISVGLCLFVMVVFEAEHPPAAGIAFGFVLEGFNLHTIVVIYFVLFILLGMRKILRPWLIDLT